MNELFTIKNINADTASNEICALSAYFWLLSLVVDALNRNVSLGKEEKMREYGIMGDILTKEFIFGDAFFELKKSENEQIQDTTDQLEDVVNDVISICDQAGIGEDKDTPRKVKETLNKLRENYLQFLSNRPVV